MPLRSLVIFCLLVSVAAAPAAAQGKGKGKGNDGGRAPAGSPVSDPITSSPATPESRSGYLGSWLDDASVIGPGAVWAGASIAWTEGGQVDFPVIDMAIGATPRTHLGISVPISHLDDGSGSSASVGQAFVYLKFRYRDASSSDDRLGIAVTPVVEISRSAIEASQEVSVGVPVNLEVRHGNLRVYGSAGYFSRGALFGGGALEIKASRRLVLTGTVGHTYSISSDAAPGAHRTDVGVGVSTPVTPVLSVFGALGRSSTSETSGFWVAAGISVFGKGR